MPFVSPMLASPLPAGFNVQPGRWFVEEKFDGHRLVTEVIDQRADLFHPKTVVAWSRDGLERTLPPHIIEAAQRLPAGIYDGELITPGGRAYDVKRLDKFDEQVYILFDVIKRENCFVTGLSWLIRREVLATATREFPVHGNPFSISNVDAIRLARATGITGNAEVTAMAEDVWKRGGEGLILKDRESTYEIGKRRKTWIKIKEQRTAVLRVTGFEEGRLGPCSVTCLVDEEGITATTKTKNTAIRTAIQVNPEAYIGRYLRVDYQYRTPDGKYQHTTWDRWEDE
jgi:DNA ligase-1